MTNLRNSYKNVILAGLTALCVVLTFYCHLVLHIDVVYSHFYYIPIVLACLWWKKRGLAVTVFFMALLLSTHVFANGFDATFFEDLVRAGIFLFVGVVISLSSARLRTMEQELRENNEFHQTVLNSLAYPFYVLDADDYSIKISNLEAHLGKAVPEYTTCYQITHKSSVPCNTDEHGCPLSELKKTGQPQKMEHIHYDKDGKLVTVEVYAFPVFDAKGHIAQIIEYSIDISERKKVEAEREKLIDKLEAALADVKQLSGMLPICASCKKIRNDNGYWDEVANYITLHSRVLFTHCLCPDCHKKSLDELAEFVKKNPGSG